ncbi:Hypothetical predicted protein, partial [Olea europaea subsp. europaea]
GKVAEAEDLALQMKNKGSSLDVVTYNSLIYGYSNAAEIEKCLWLYKKMKTLGIKPTLYTYHPLISICKREGLQLVEKIIQEIAQINLTPDRIVYNELIHCCVEHGDVCKAFALHSEM